MSVVEESFKNVYVSDGGNGVTLYERTEGGGLGTRLATFKNDEYDLHISFKRKPRPIEVGDVVRVYGELSGQYSVLAQCKDPNRLVNGTYSWIKNKRSSSIDAPRTILTVNLRRIEADD